MGCQLEIDCRRARVHRRLPARGWVESGLVEVDFAAVAAGIYKARPELFSIGVLIRNTGAGSFDGDLDRVAHHS